MRIVLIFSLAVHTASIYAQCPQLVWEDNFEGNSLDLTHWNVQEGDGCDLGICGWGNNELQYYQEENAEVADGILKIVAKRESVGNKSYSSARLTTKGKGDWTYGRFEARIKTPTGKGMWPAFWMLSSTEPYGTWPQSGEIDIMELIGSDPNVAHGTIHFGSPPPNNRSATESYILNDGTFDQDFHTFAVEWESTELRWIVDGYLYSTKTKAATGGARWPFDHDFHILLNLAVGGNWPGFPDNKTVFPQPLEVDYVRVYDGFFATLSGQRSVEYQAKGEKYRINNIFPTSTITWLVPPDATLVDGQGTANVTIDWNEDGGALKAVYSDGCSNDTITLEVAVAARFGRQLVLENFDDSARIDFNFATGMLTDDFANPEAKEPNTSALCGKYERNGAELFDVLIYDVTVIENTAPFISNEKRFYLDVYTDAPVGTLLLLQLENSSRSRPTNYPIGRNSRFEARTTVQSQWERLQLTYLDQPDPATSNSSTDQLILLLGSNTNLVSTFYIDNFDVYAPEETVQTNQLGHENLAFYPNPSPDYLYLKDIQGVKFQQISILSMAGQTQFSVKGNRQAVIERIDITRLPPGLYIIQLQLLDGRSQLGRFMKIDH